MKKQKQTTQQKQTVDITVEETLDVAGLGQEKEFYQLQVGVLLVMMFVE